MHTHMRCLPPGELDCPASLNQHVVDLSKHDQHVSQARAGAERFLLPEGLTMIPGLTKYSPLLT